MIMIMIIIVITIRDMTNTIEEWPREFEQSLLFHGVPVPDNESFYTKVVNDHDYDRYEHDESHDYDDHELYDNDGHDS